MVGPETLTGSSRMKGGSATKFLLEVIFARAIANACSLDLVPSPAIDAPVPSRPVTTEGVLFAYETTYRCASSASFTSVPQRLTTFFLPCRYTYNSIANVSPLMVAAGNSLRDGGHVYYLSSGSVSVLATVDASGSCIITYLQMEAIVWLTLGILQLCDRVPSHLRLQVHGCSRLRPRWMEDNG